MNSNLCKNDTATKEQIYTKIGAQRTKIGLLQFIIFAIKAIKKEWSKYIPRLFAEKEPQILANRELQKLRLAVRNTNMEGK